MLFLNDIQYRLPNNLLLLSGIHLRLNAQEKIALIGPNGSGKSTIVRLISGELVAQQGTISSEVAPYILPQLFGQYDQQTVAWAMRVEQKWLALQSILAGTGSEDDFDRLNDDWTVEDRCQQALAKWECDALSLEHQLGELSGGEKMKVFLSGLSLHTPQLIVLDEPTNHLDQVSRRRLLNWLEATEAAVLLISHDRSLLEGVDQIAELGPNGIELFGGNYTFYKAQKELQQRALADDVAESEKAIRKAKAARRLVQERNQRQNNRGKEKKSREGTSRIMMNTLKNQAEKSTAKHQHVHASKIARMGEQLQKLRAATHLTAQMKVNLDPSSLHTGKELIRTAGMNFTISGHNLWSLPIDLQVRSGDRLAISGSNGSGKTTLVELLLGEKNPTQGSIHRVALNWLYIDQDYGLLKIDQTVLQQADSFNTGGLEDHEIKTQLDRFLFPTKDWDKPCSELSGGERMRLSLCCLSISAAAPDLIILDEPTNNLDLENLDILRQAIADYQGTLLVISHDLQFREEINITQTLDLDEHHSGK